MAGCVHSILGARVPRARKVERVIHKLELALALLVFTLEQMPNQSAARVAAEDAPARRRTRRPSRQPTLANAGQFELLLTGAPLAAIADAGGVTRMAASLWRRGQGAPDWGHAAKLEAAFGIPRHLWGLVAPTSEGQRLCFLLNVSAPQDPDGFQKLMLYSFFFVPQKTWDQKPGRLRTWEQFRAYVAALSDPASMPQGDPPPWGERPAGAPRTIEEAIAAEERREAERAPRCAPAAPTLPSQPPREPAVRPEGWARRPGEARAEMFARRTAILRGGHN